MRRRLRHGGPAVAVLALALLSACVIGPVVRFAQPVPGARVEQIFVAATPGWLPGSDGRLAAGLGAPRLPGLAYGLVEVSVPPAHESGNIEWPPPRGEVDPAQHFVVAGQRRLPSPAAFEAALRRAPGGADGTRILYVHGFNNELSEVVFRLAQIRADFRPSLPSAAFVWPSAGDARGYLYDRDSALFARDELEDLLRLLTTRTGGRVVLVAHSLGAFLVMETLRQIAARPGGRAVLGRVAAVVLMAPDIDPDVFRRQAEAIGRLPRPFLIFVARQDRVLSLSAFLRGRKEVLGQIRSADEVAGLPVTVIDFTALAPRRALDHAVPVTAPAAIAWLRRMLPEIGRRDSRFGHFIAAGTSQQTLPALPQPRSGPGLSTTPR